MEERKCRQCGADLRKRHGRAVLCGSVQCKRLDANEKARKAYAEGGAYRDKALSKKGLCSKCGIPVHVGGGSRDEPICRECRAIAKVRKCVKCEVSFSVNSATNKRTLCASCGGYRGAYGTAEESRAAKAERNRRKCRARRAMKLGLPSEKYTTAEIITRDNYRCGICELTVNPLLSGSHEYGPTIDHVIPISKGGPDTRDNVQLAHRICNTRKGDRV